MPKRFGGPDGGGALLYERGTPVTHALRRISAKSVGALVLCIKPTSSLSVLSTPNLIHEISCAGFCCDPLYRGAIM